MAMLYHVLSLVLITSFATPQITPQDIDDVITAYRQTSVETFKQRMPPPARNNEFRESIYQNLPAEFRCRIDDPKAIRLLRQVLEPVLALYGRLEFYDIVIVKNPTGLMMSDSGVLLVVTTGMIENAASDDELLGYAAHEVAHEYFVFYSVESRHLLQTISDRGNEPALKRKMADVLTLTELQCDAFAALTLSALQYNPTDFIQGLERIDAAYPTIRKDNHPPTMIRRRVVESVAPAHFPPRESPAFKELKARLAK
jgi:predicted Zn-dependent protease